MRKLLLLSMLTSLGAQAALVHFDLSPAGKDTALGLSPGNIVPAITNSTGSGGVLSNVLVFNTDTRILSMVIGCGSSAGFTDLTGELTGAAIHGPAGPGTNAAALVDLSGFIFKAADPTKGGIILASVEVATNAIADLMAGLDYLVVSTATNAAGELRGQLSPLPPINLPPFIGCLEPMRAECGSPVRLAVLAADPEGDALRAVWTVNGVAVSTNRVPARTPGAAVTLSYTANRLPIGTNVVGITVTDTATNSASCATLVIVADHTPPTLVDLRADPSTLWPPNHKMINITIHGRAVDACSTATWRITKVTCNEAVNARGSGNTGPDWVITGDHTLQVRAERTGNNSGRVYYISVQAKDAAGNLSEIKVVTVTVPKSQGK